MALITSGALGCALHHLASNMSCQEIKLWMCVIPAADLGFCEGRGLRGARGVGAAQVPATGPRKALCHWHCAALRRLGPPCWRIVHICYMDYASALPPLGASALAQLRQHAGRTVHICCMDYDEHQAPHSRRPQAPRGAIGQLPGDVAAALTRRSAAPSSSPGFLSANPR